MGNQAILREYCSRYSGSRLIVFTIVRVNPLYTTKIEPNQGLVDRRHAISINLERLCWPFAIVADI